MPLLFSSIMLTEYSANITESGGSEHLGPCLPYLALKINYDLSYMLQNLVLEVSPKTNQKLEA